MAQQFRKAPEKAHRRRHRRWAAQRAKAADRKPSARSR